MNLEEYHKMHALEKQYWWFQGRRKVILDTLRQHARRDSASDRPVILDIGCGTGMMLEDLQQMGSATGLDFSMVALEYCQKRGINKLGRADVRNIPVKSNSVDIITALDLIEHIEDDHGLMSEFQRVLKPGGIAVMSVPAHKKLWSGHDVALHHFRRYEKPEFRKLVEGAGLRPRKYTYGMATAYVPAILIRNYKKLRGLNDKNQCTDEFPIPAWLNGILKKSVEAESIWLRKFDLPVGLSLLCVAEK
jgi:ubiquinone/menaquinone biosynthesis C-methylase UbiE